MEKNRSSFTSKLGFVLAAAGSAVGLGNLWRFPYLAAKHGGGIFLLVYVILAVTFGFALMTAEIALGRKTGLSPIGAYRALDRRFSFLGWLSSAIPMLILPYYCVIGGWVTKYLAVFVTGKGAEAANDAYFSGFIAKTGEPLLWFAIYLGLTALVVLFGVEKGIEKVSKVMMPVLVVLSLGIAIYSICMPGAMQGVIYYLKPDFSHFTIMTVVAACGQLFYSMSIAMGILITYGSYMKKDVSIESSVRQIELFDTGIAFLAGLMIIPAVFAFSGGDEEALGQGPGLMFVMLPKVFDSMKGGAVIGAVFFVLVLFAALTSSISLMETVVSILQDKLGWGRKGSCLAVLFGAVLLGLPSSLGYGAWGGVTLLGMPFLDFFDFISNSILMPIVALGTCVFIGYVLKPRALVEEVELTGRFKKKKLFCVMIRYVAPVFLLMILVSAVLSAFGVIAI
ncbi:MAG: sodium-dependent transporter [Ruminococcaceae bacterium]|nr:sodium-dependent transporter [Oscillospiraceae bacterium]